LSTPTSWIAAISAAWENTPVVVIAMLALKYSEGSFSSGCLKSRTSKRESSRESWKGRNSCRPALRRPVVYGPLDCVARHGLRAQVLLGLEIPQLGGDFSTSTAGDLVPPPRLPARPVAGGDSGVPAALGLVLVDRSLAAPAAPGLGTRSAHSWEPNTACSPCCSRRLLTCSI
jgi:hypothetical protein